MTWWMESVDFILSLSCLESWKWRGSFAHLLAFWKILQGFLSVSRVPGTPEEISRPTLGQPQPPHLPGASAAPHWTPQGDAQVFAASSLLCILSVPSQPITLTLRLLIGNTACSVTLFVPNSLRPRGL